MPFENLGPTEQEYFADGLTEEITNRLSAIHGLGLISRTSARQYKKTNKTIKQIGDIFAGEITNWKDVGGPNKPIVTYSRESSSGTYAFFRKNVLGGREYTSAALLAPATGAIVQSVSQTPGAIGYIGMAYMTESVVALDVAKEEKTHVGEFQAMLLKLDAEQVEELAHGKEEVEEITG